MREATYRNDFMVVFITRDSEGLVCMAPDQNEATRLMRLYIAEQDHLASILRFDIRLWVYHNGFDGNWLNVKSVLVSQSLMAKRRRRERTEESQGGESHEEAA